MHSLRGLGQGLWAFASSPVKISQEFIDVLYACIEYIQEHSTQEVLEIIVPELKELILKWENLSDYDKGQKIGFVIGKYGIEILACSGTMKGIKLFHDLRRANAMFTLENCAISAKNKAYILEEASKRAAFRQGLVKNGKIKIHWESLDKHIVGARNFQQGRSIITISKEKLEKLLFDHAGTGQVVGKKLPGMAGYKERIDFGELIGECVFKENNIEMRLKTTKGIIHYDTEGYMHLVPSRP